MGGELAEVKNVLYWRFANLSVTSIRCVKLNGLIKYYFYIKDNDFLF